MGPKVAALIPGSCDWNLSGRRTCNQGEIQSFGWNLIQYERCPVCLLVHGSELWGASDATAALGSSHLVGTLDSP